MRKRPTEATFRCQWLPGRGSQRKSVVPFTALITNEPPRDSRMLNLGQTPSLVGLPRRFPFARAFRTPARTRSAIRLRSSSATAPRTVKIIFPVGVEVSTCSDSETNSMPRERKVSSARSRCETERAKRSNRQTTTASKFLRCASAISLSSSGRFSFAPEIPTSTYSRATSQFRQIGRAHV